MLASGLQRKHFHVKCKRAGAARRLRVNPWKAARAARVASSHSLGDSREHGPGHSLRGQARGIKGAAGLRQVALGLDVLGGWGHQGIGRGPLEAEGQPAAGGGAVAHRHVLIRLGDA